MAAIGARKAAEKVVAEEEATQARKVAEEAAARSTQLEAAARRKLEEVEHAREEYKVVSSAIKIAQKHSFVRTGVCRALRRIAAPSSMRRMRVLAGATVELHTAAAPPALRTSVVFQSAAAALTAGCASAARRCRASPRPATRAIFVLTRAVPPSNRPSTCCSRAPQLPPGAAPQAALPCDAAAPAVPPERRAGGCSFPARPPGRAAPLRRSVEY
eukprot:3504534-Pleurochrysis_carterae.AAC.1